VKRFDLINFSYIVSNFIASITLKAKFPYAMPWIIIPAPFGSI
jgi:hypothetical protein